MAFEEILTYIPLLTIVAFIITIALLFYRLGQWTKNLENSLKDISTKLDNVSKGIDKVPEQFWSKFIDAYRMLGMVKSKGNPSRSRKDILLEKAKNRTISYEESLELKDMLEREAKQAQAVGDFFAFLIIMGILLFLGAIIADLFKEG
ncbi:MAG: hypothetical protein QW146_07885 [Candidatus Bathyarchaeia archaeon]